MLPLGLSMLWETVEPGDALRTRFGFDSYRAAVEWISTTLSSVWGITATDCRRVVISDRNAIVWVASSHGPLVMKWSNARERFAGLAASTQLLQRLDRQGIPVATPIATADGRVRVVRDGPLGPLSVAVLPELAGDWLDLDDDVAVRAAGACLADLHEVLRDSSGDRPQVGPEVPAFNGQIRHWLAHQDPGWVLSASSRLQTVVTGLPVLGDQVQLVHHDFRAANILTRESRVVAVLDFDEMTWGHPVNDLARASLYLGTRFRDWRPTSVAVRQRFRAGYESVRPLRAAEARWLDALALWHGIAAVSSPGDPAGWAAVE